jgi:hypothetical protein
MTDTKDDDFESYPWKRRSKIMKQIGQKVTTTETKDNRVASNQTLNLFRAADTAVGRINSLQHAIGNRATQMLLRTLVPSERTGVMVQRQQAQLERTVQERADNIIAELGPLIMSDRVVLDNLQGTGMEDVLRRIDSVTEAGFTYLAWMLKRVDGSEKQELVTLPWRLVIFGRLISGGAKTRQILPKKGRDSAASLRNN